MFMDSAVQDAAIASAGLLRRSLVSFHRDDTEWALPATASQFPGNGASDDPRTDDPMSYVFIALDSLRPFTGKIRIQESLYAR